MHNVSRRRLASSALVFAALGLTAAGCNLLLGLDEFVDCSETKCTSTTTSTTTGTGGATNSTTTPTNTAGSGGTIPDPTCDDLVKNGTESDVDCGGSCMRCDDGKTCGQDGDCTSGVCSGGTCAKPTCVDDTTNGDETDKDCGGMTCPKCVYSQGCLVDGDCEGGSCLNGTCAATCTDELLNGDESDKDCGGSSCPKCVVDKVCSVNGDCESGVCQAQKCVSYYVWAKSFGDQNPQQPSGLAVDTAGSVIISGATQGTVNFGGMPLASAGGRDAFIAKFDKDGTHKWSKVFGDAKDQIGLTVATDAAQNVVMAGRFTGFVDFGGGTLGSGGFTPGTATSMFMAKFDTDGNHLWGKVFGGGVVGVNFTVPIQGLVTDPHLTQGGFIYVTGGFSGNINMGGGALVSATPAAEDVFLASYDKSGNHVWSKRFGGTGREFATSVAYSTFNTEFLVVGGWFDGGSLDLGGGPLAATPTKGHLFVAKLYADGSHAWSKSFPTLDSYEFSSGTGGSVGVDSMGSVYVVGHQHPFSAVDFGGGSLSGNYYLVKMSADGDHLWSKGFSAGEKSTGWTPVMITVDAADNVVISNKYIGMASPGGQSLSAQSTMYVTKFNTNGDLVWTGAWGDASSTSGAAPTGMGASGAKFLYISGGYDGQIDFGAGPLTSLGQDIFLAKLLLP